MSENRFKEFIIAIDEYIDEIKQKYQEHKDDILDIMNENIFVSGYENIFQEGLNAYGRGRYKRAIYYFEKANKESKNNFSCLYNLGLAHQSANNVEQAIEYYTEALNIVPNDNDTIYNLGLCFLSVNDGEFAEKYLKIASENAPNDYNARMSYILAIIKCGQIDNGIKKAIHLIKSNKSYIDFSLSVAKCIEEQCFGEADAANISKSIKLLNSYLKAFPKSSEAQIELSVCYGKIGSWDLALKHSLNALAIDSKSYENNKQAGHVYYCSQNYTEALKYYEKALFIQPIKNFEMNYNIALTYEKMGKIKDMEKKVRYILKKFKKHPQIKSIEILLEKINEIKYSSNTSSEEQKYSEFDENVDGLLNETDSESVEQIEQVQQESPIETENVQPDENSL